ncbi:hypothetical protein EW146_g8764 [Bondarzewia mesenterica]|uniref:AN1-type domain-containing protein n=1 Tax=Bondarzewia mesenterica TaxID=1095465 RepID=A0A4S4LBZ0_9AGAM|nr:hypothetical protein EW146_g8764 [Bondarzewia mesenterica]
MDLAPIGAHCSLASCNELDLLPIRCLCDQQFCRNHFLPDAHACPVDTSKRSAGLAFAKLQRCALVNCSKPSLEAYMSKDTDDSKRTRALCPRCMLAYCATHRDPASHSCPILEQGTEQKNQAAHVLLAKHFPNPPSSSRTTDNPRRVAQIPTDPKKLAQFQKVELMKMRHRAGPGDPKDKNASVSVDQRLHVKVKSSEPDAVGTVFWFRKVLSPPRAGRALDHLATQLKVPTPTSTVLQLSKVSLIDPDNVTVLRNDQTLAEQVEDGSLLLVSSASLSLT